MIKYKDKEVKDLGEIVKGYFNGILAFHKTKLPINAVCDVEYWFNYNAKNYNMSGRIPSDGGTYGEDMVFNKGSYPIKVGDFLEIKKSLPPSARVAETANCPQYLFFPFLKLHLKNT